MNQAKIRISPVLLSCAIFKGTYVSIVGAEWDESSTMPFLILTIRGDEIPPTTEFVNAIIKKSIVTQFVPVEQTKGLEI